MWAGWRGRHGRYGGPGGRGIVSGRARGAVAAGGVLGPGCSAGTAAGGPASPASPAKSATPSHAPAPKARPPERLPVGTLGGYAVAEQKLRLVDRSRVRLGPRALLTAVWYPLIPHAAAASGRLARGLFPLVVFGPGYGVCAESYGPLLRAWASAGYVVAGIDFPLTSCDPINQNDMVNQPADMADVIPRLLAVSDRSSGFLGGLIGPDKIAVAGQSDGGDTVAALVANTCCRYRDVTATIVLAGAQYPPMGRSYSTHP